MKAPSWRSESGSDKVCEAGTETRVLELDREAETRNWKAKESLLRFSTKNKAEHKANKAVTGLAKM